MLNALFLALSLGAGFAQAEGRRYQSLDQGLKAAGLHSKLVEVVAARHGWTTLRQLRTNLARAMIYGIYPLNTKIAANLRRAIAECDVPDHVAILTKAELEFAETYADTRLSLRARYVLSRFDIRTLAGLRAETFASEMSDDKATIKAIAQLRAMGGECPRRLQSEYVGEDQGRHD